MARSRGLAARLAVPLWACIGLVLALLVFVGEATATAEGNPEATPTAAASTSPGVARAALAPAATVTEVASEPEDHDALEMPGAARAPVPGPASVVLDPPTSAPFVDTGRPSISTGLGRGPPKAA